MNGEIKEELWLRYRKFSIIIIKFIVNFLQKEDLS